VQMLSPGVAVPARVEVFPFGALLRKGSRLRVSIEAPTELPELWAFADFPENDLWEVIKLSKWAKFKPETSLIKEGDHGDSFFILAGGYVRVTRGKKTLTVLTAGDCFGEMSYLKKTGDDHRSATVTTTSDTIVMKIRADDLKQASQSVKRLFDERFLAILVARLEAANQQLSVMS